MASDLDDRLRRYATDLDEAARADLDARVSDEIVTAVVQPLPRRPRPVAIAVAGLLVAAAVIGVVLVLRPASRGTLAPDTTTIGSGTEAGPETTLAPIGGLTITEDFPTEVQMPAVPDGWQVLDFRDFRFAVPGDWTVPASSCTVPATGVVQIDDGVDLDCSPIATAPAESLSFVRHGQYVPVTGSTTTVGTLQATVVAPECATCVPRYQFDNGWDVMVTGSNADAILATFTDSGARRVLQEGPRADTTDWSTITFEGVEVRVPSTWRQLDLPASVTRTTDASGDVIGGGGVPDPGTCRLSMFGHLDGPTAFLGSAGIVPSCPPVLQTDLAPSDGLWLREDDGSRNDQPWTAIGLLGGAQVELLDWPLPGIAASRPLELRVRSVSSPNLLLSLGVGLDASVARSILHSMRQVDADIVMEPGTDPSYIETTDDPAGAVGIDAPSLFDGGIAMVVFVHHGATVEQVSLIKDALESSGVADGGGIEYLNETAMRAEIARVVSSASDRARIEADLPTMFTIRTGPTMERGTLERFGNEFLTVPNVIDVRIAPQQ